MRRLLTAVTITASLALAACGGDDSESKRTEAGRTYCESLQKAGSLLEPMRQCLKEYETATREP